MKPKTLHIWSVLVVVFLSACSTGKADLLWSINLVGNLRSINPYNASSTLVGTVTGNGNEMVDVAYGAGNLWSLDLKGYLTGC